MSWHHRLPGDCSSSTADINFVIVRSWAVAFIRMKLTALHAYFVSLSSMELHATLCTVRLAFDTCQAIHGSRALAIGTGTSGQ